jgi:hypothetical protein
VCNEWVYVSRDVVFDKNIFSFLQHHPNIGAHYAEILLLPPTLCHSIEHEVVDNHRAHGANPGLEINDVQANEIAA